MILIAITRLGTKLTGSIYIRKNVEVKVIQQFMYFILSCMLSDQISNIKIVNILQYTCASS